MNRRNEAVIAACLRMLSGQVSDSIDDELPVEPVTDTEEGRDDLTKVEVDLPASDRGDAEPDDTEHVLVIRADEAGPIEALDDQVHDPTSPIQPGWFIVFEHGGVLHGGPEEGPVGRVLKS